MISRFALAARLGCLFGFLSGSIFAAELGGLVRSQGLPIPGATITATQGDKKVVGTSGADGRYSLAGVDPGEWSVSVEMFGFAPLSKTVRVSDPKSDENWDLSLETPAVEAAGRGPGGPSGFGPGGGPRGQAGRFRQLGVNQSNQIDAILRSMEAAPGVPSPEQFQDASESYLVNGTLSTGLTIPQRGGLFRGGFGGAQGAAPNGPAGNPFGNDASGANTAAAAAGFGGPPGGFGPGGPGGPGPGFGGRGGPGGGRGFGGPGGPGGRGGPGGGRGFGGRGPGGPGGPSGPGGAPPDPERLARFREMMERRRGAMNFGNRIGAGRPAMRGMLNFSLGNSALDAKSYSLTGAAIDKPSYAQSSFGAAIGGQLKIPKIVNDENTFFFLNYRGTRSRRAYSASATAPSELERIGDFSQSLVRGPVSIIDPSTGEVFPNQQIPLSRIDSASAGLTNYLALPNLPGAVRNYQFLTSIPNNSDNISIRAGRNLDSKDRLAGNYNLQLRNSESAQLQGFRDSGDGRGQNAGLNWTRTIRPTIISNLGFTFSRNRNQTIPYFSLGSNVAAQLGIKGTSQDPVNYGPPNLSFTNFGDLSDASPSLARNQTTGLSEGMTIVAGNHTYTFGAEYKRLQINTLSDPNGRGTFSFSGIATSALDSNGLPVAGTGFDFADFLLGLPQSSSIRYGNPDTYLRSQAYNVFVQDDWRITANLSVNLGVRYEYLTPFTERYNRLVNLDVAPGVANVEPVLPGASGPFTGRFPNTLIDPDRNNIAPRLGIAWKPWARRSTVVRGGYGVYFNGSIYNQAASRLAQQAPFSTTSTLTTGIDGLLTVQNGFGASPTTDITNTFAVLRNYRAGYAQTWSFGVQTNISSSQIVEVSYLGTKGTRLDIQRSPNQAPPGSSPVEAALRPIPDAVAFTLDSAEGNSIYHAAQVRFTRRFRSGIAGNALYTWAKSIDNVSTFGGGGAVVALYNDNLHLERGLSSFDQRHSLNLSFVVTSPVGRNSGTAPSRNFFETLFREWNLTGGLTAATGTPLTATVLGNQANAAGSGVVGSGRASATGQPIGLDGAFFNPAAFTVPTAGQFGNAARNTIPGPRQLSLNVSIGRSFRLDDERRALEFRIETQNLTNTVSFTRLGTTVNSSNYGLATGAGDMRTVSASLRFRF